MKIKHTFSWLAGATVYVAAAILLMGYENVKMHPAISETILDAFVDKFVHALVPPANLDKYTFVFDGSATFSGPAVTNSGYFSSTTGISTVSKTPKDWLKHGGYSADEPEVPASLRHFYDPLGIDGGKKYLTNRGTNWEFIINNNGLNPRIDARDWALHHQDNSWTWDKGKEWVEKALTTNDKAKRDDYMARAWRCLGETLHLIADMGCPPHVRNDSHAAPVGWKYRIALGDPDPFEELVKPSYAATYRGGAVDPALKSSCRATKSADEVFETMARFTNKHFFTNQTISGMGVKKITPIIDDRPAYPSPKLDKLVYDPLDYTFYQTLPGGQRVKMCKDKSWFSLRGYPYIDAECVESQAAALMPNIAEAGANLIRLFMPALEVKVEKATPDGLVEGKVTHKTTGEYANKLTYQGEVTVLVNNKTTAKAQVDQYGAFTVENLTLTENDKVTAEIGFGGIYVKSNELTVSSLDVLAILHECNDVTISLYGEHVFSNETSTEPISIAGNASNFQPQDYIKWTEQSFTKRYERVTEDEDKKLTSRVTITGNVSHDGKIITSLVADSYQEEYWKNGKFAYKWSKKLEVQNVPVTHTTYFPDNHIVAVLCEHEGSSTSLFFTKVALKTWMEDATGTTIYREYKSTNWNSSSATPRLNVEFRKWYP